MVLMNNARGWYENVDNDEGGSFIGETLAACLWIFSKAVKETTGHRVWRGKERETYKRYKQDLQPLKTI